MRVYDLPCKHDNLYMNEVSSGAVYMDGGKS